MSAKIIDGKAIAARVRVTGGRRGRGVRRRHGRTPGLATVLVGEDPGSAVYVAGKQKACREVGMEAFDRRLPATASAEQVADELHALNADDAVSGVLLQLPLPDRLEGPQLTALISPEKDVDGLTPVNVGLLSIGRPGLRPCTPLGVMELLAEAEVDARGRRSRRGRALQPVRQADGPAAARGQRDRHDLPLAHPRPAGRVRACRGPDRGRGSRPRMVEGDFVAAGRES